MRRLWIRRHKNGGGKLTVYIEDLETGDVTINGLPCRKLGELADGQHKRYTIGQDAVKVFLTAGKIGENMPFRQIPEGQDDIFLSGKKQGKTFRYDDAEEEDPSFSPKKGGWLAKVILVIAILLGLAAGFFAGRMITEMVLSGRETPAVEKSFICQDLTITLTDRFRETEVDGYTACYASGDAAVFALREPFDAKEGFGDLSVVEYGTMVLTNNALAKTVTLEDDGGMIVFRYESSGYWYYTVLLKGTDAFWMVQFTALTENAQAYMQIFRQWAQGIVLSA